MDNMAGKESKLSIIEQKIAKLYLTVDKLDSLIVKIMGTGNPIPKCAKDTAPCSTRNLNSLIHELPDQLSGLTERITKSIEAIDSVIC